jgi:hypothetical protein
MIFQLSIPVEMSFVFSSTDGVTLITASVLRGYFNFDKNELCQFDGENFIFPVDINLILFISSSNLQSHT